MLRVGLTGGVASGKSLVAEMLEQFGATLVDADIVAREVVAPGEPALAAIVERFGQSILQADGQLDRVRMRELVFSDPERRAALEALLHPEWAEEKRRLTPPENLQREVFVYTAVDEVKMKADWWEVAEKAITQGKQ